MSTTINPHISIVNVRSFSLLKYIVIFFLQKYENTIAVHIIPLFFLLAKVFGEQSKPLESLPLTSGNNPPRCARRGGGVSS